MATTIHVGYVIADDGSIYLQVPCNNSQGWRICDDEQSWDVPPFGSWEAIAEDDPRITEDDRDRLQWILDEL